MTRKPRKRGTIMSRVTLRAAGRHFDNVPVRAVRRKRDEYPPDCGSAQIYFAIDVESVGNGRTATEARLHVVHKDIDELVKKANAKLEELLTIEWTDVLQVRVEDGANQWDSNVSSAGLAVQYEPHQIGVRGKDEKVHRETPRESHRAPAIYSGVLRECDEDDGDGRRVIAVIPDTQENREALDTIIRALDTLRARLSDLLQPKAILSTLTNMAVLQLPEATAPATKKKARRRKAATVAPPRRVRGRRRTKA